MLRIKTSELPELAQGERERQTVKDLRVNKDIAIIGGSAAGFFTAYLLARQGCKVRVYDSKKDSQASPRSLIVTSYVENLLGSVCRGSVINKVSRFELFADGRVATVALSRPDLVIDRSGLIRSLASQAEADGAQVLRRSRFLDLKSNGEKLTFTISRNGGRERTDESAEILVGADGALSTVAKSAGWPTGPTVPLIQAVVELPRDMPSDTARVWFIPDDTPYFYWLIPHSPTHGVFGLIGNDGQDIRVPLERFLEKRGLQPKELQNAQVPQFTGWTPNHLRIGESHVYLVGDAASHVKISTVGGLVTGLRGSLGVAEAILNAGFSREIKALRHELDLHLLIRRALNRFTQKDYASLLDLLAPSVKRSLGLINRDESGKLLFHVFVKQPRLLLLALRSVLIGR